MAEEEEKRDRGGGRTMAREIAEELRKHTAFVEDPS